MNDILVAQKLQKYMNTCRKFYGSSWPDKQKEWGNIVAAVMKKENCSILEAAITIGQQLEGFSLMTMLGTVSEMVIKEQQKSL